MPERAQKTRVLIVTTGRITQPRMGGELRTHHLAVELSALGYEVEVCSFIARRARARAWQIGARLTIVEQHSLWLDLAQVADRLGLIPITELPRWLAPLRLGFAGMVRGERYDIVQFECLWHGALFKPARAGGAQVVYNSQNVESEWWTPILKERGFGARWTERLRRREREAIAAASAVAVCSERERLWMLEQGGADGRPVAIVPNGYDARKLARPSPEARQQARRRLGFAPEEKIAFFIASNTAPNREAARAIVDRIAPAAPEIRFVIAGRVGEAFTPEPAPNVTVTGPVDDVIPYLHGADVALNPMGSGSGSNIKLAEYCAAGLPVITTEFGLRGFERLRPWLLVRPLEQFAAAVREARWPQPIPEVELSQFSWSHAARQLANLYQRLS